MIINIDQIIAGVTKYIDTVLAPRANGFDKFKLYFYVPSLPKYITKKVDEFKMLDTEHEFFTEEGNIKLDEAYNRAKTAIDKSGKLLIRPINYFADSEDLDTLYSLIQSV